MVGAPDEPGGAGSVFHDLLHGAGVHSPIFQSIVQAADDTVTFSCKKPKNRRNRYMTLGALDFMGRFLQHLLPPGFMKGCGFMNACNGVCLENVRAAIEMMHAFKVTVPESTREVHGKIRPICPDCGSELRCLHSVLPHQMPGYRGSG